MTDSDHERPLERLPDRAYGGEQPSETPLEPRASVAVPVGGLLVVISFFLPWVNAGPSTFSGFELAFQARAAGALLERFGVYTSAPTTITRPLVLVPLMALGVLMLNLNAGRHLVTRLVSKALILVTGIMMTVAFGYVGWMVVELRLAPAFWSTFSGGLLIALGSVFDVVRGD